MLLETPGGDSRTAKMYDRTPEADTCVWYWVKFVEDADVVSFEG